MIDPAKSNTESSGRKQIPLGIAFLRQFVADDLPSRHSDAFIVAMVIAELQDYCHGRAVGFYVGQLATKAGMGCKNPRRLRSAIKYLIEAGYLEQTVPPVGSRQQTLFRLILKAGSIDTRQNDGSEQATPTSNDGGEDVDPRQNGSVTPVNLTVDPRQNGSTSNPVLCNPISSNPNTPLIPRMGELFDSGKSDQQKSGKPSKPRRQKPPATEVETIWQHYPRKVDKPRGFKAIQHALTKIPFADLLAIVKEYAAAVATWPASDKQYIPHPSTWFNGERWTQDRAEWKRTNGHKPNAITVGDGVRWREDSPVAALPNGGF